MPGKLPEAIGVYANQPNPWAGLRGGCGGCSPSWPCLPVLVQAFFLFLSSEKLLLRQDFNFEPRSTDEVQSREFTVAGKARKIAVRQSNLARQQLAGCRPVAGKQDDRAGLAGGT